MVTLLHAIITGRVQGVSFRHNTRVEANRLHINGWVRNRSDGSVEVCAQGGENNLQQFIHFLQTGPTGARVEKADLKWMETSESFDTFEIRHDL